MQYQPIDKSEDEDKFFNYIEAVSYNVFEKCKDCNRGTVTLLVNKETCEKCDGKGYKVFPDSDLQRGSIEYFNKLWKSNHNTKPVTEIVSWCKVQQVVASSYLKLKDEHDQFHFPDYWTEPIGYKEVISSTVVLEEDEKMVRENNLDKLLFCLVYHTHE